MKIIQIDTIYEYSSTGRTTAEMHNYFQQHDIDSYVFCTNYHLPEKNIFKFSNKWDMKLHALLSRIFGLQGMFSYFSTKKLIKHLKKINPDVIHLRVLHCNCINLPLLLNYLSKNNVPTVITLHDCWFFTGHCCYFLDPDCDGWKNKCGNCPHIKKWNKSLFFDNSSLQLAIKKRLFGEIQNLAVIGVSDWVTNFIKYSILKDSHIIKRIYNWIDCSKYTDRDSNTIRKKYGFNNNDFVVLGVAKIWTKQKGIDEFIKLAELCHNFKFVIVGQVLEIDLPQNIICLGVLSDLNQLIDMYFMSDVFFNPSIGETFGKVTLESIASGTPVVAYNATATPEIVAEGCGYLVNVGDIEDVINKFNTIKNNKKSSYSEICRNYALNNFSKDNIIQQYIELYENLRTSK